MDLQLLALLDLLSQGQLRDEGQRMINLLFDFYLNQFFQTIATE
jgi:hypothetical protein